MTSAARPRRTARLAAALRSVPARGRRAAVTAALVGATLLAGPLPAAEAGTAASASVPVVDGATTAVETSSPPASRPSTRGRSTRRT
ncbi:hypothetical protein [Nocardioides marinisabuli]|uniref:hypothetical protein n=1 Tax=Nocardioides marinisabuli TaxID=419476 RepID=UPI0015DF2D9A|nr:hypothetical protein [Nocardioides marinisabuli]